MSFNTPFPETIHLIIALSLVCILVGCMGDSFTAVHGVVVDANGNPIPGVTVTLRPKDPEEFPDVATSHADGHFWVEVPHAPVKIEFVLELKKDGFLTYTTTVEEGKRHQGMRIVMIANKQTQQTTKNVKETASEETSDSHDSKEPVVPASKGE